MSLSESDFRECEKFFAQRLSDIIRRGSLSIAGLRPSTTTTQQLENLCLAFDLLGTECIKEVKLANTPPARPSERTAPDAPPRP
ncbi:protein UL91 [Common bottlenose dolphin gammaherpesvirus 1 strain Sarasota]|uniref:Protein UL91 n=1 Tax=Common bottlenose dolphin gammaherpesvirus 1 strain Sarasota TaxID=2022783 RepID=A0A1Z1NEH5_9GAMA|nr:protein UL91 [Common bottlenose dolphin gammaherpesvirus 1 strain Sarasota]ARW78093.1 protein UL91 [Common bottlenose dolphin gammaherpesvirus 1 strain Sarasota]